MPGRYEIRNTATERSHSLQMNVADDFTPSSARSLTINPNGPDSYQFSFVPTPGTPGQFTLSGGGITGWARVLDMPGAGPYLLVSLVQPSPFPSVDSLVGNVGVTYKKAGQPDTLAAGSLGKRESNRASAMLF